MATERKARASVPLSQAIPAALGLSFLGAFACAVSFLTVLWLCLPETDGAKQSALPLVFLDPFVLIVLTPVTLVGGALAFVLWLVFLRRRDLGRSTLVVFGTVLVAIATTTPFVGPNGVLAAFLALLLGVFVGRRWSWCEARSTS